MIKLISTLAAVVLLCIGASGCTTAGYPGGDFYVGAPFFGGYGYDYWGNNYRHHYYHHHHYYRGHHRYTHHHHDYHHYHHH